MLILASDSRRAMPAQKPSPRAAGLPAYLRRPSDATSSSTAELSWAACPSVRSSERRHTTCYDIYDASRAAKVLTRRGPSLR
jgi:hypothetical protein